MSSRSALTATSSATSPLWLREQIIANVQLLHPDKSFINIMTGRSPLSSTTLDENGKLVPQWIHYANVYAVRAGSVKEGGEKEEMQASKFHIDILVHGRPVAGGREEAMESLAGVVEDRIEKIFGVGGLRGRK